MFAFSGVKRGQPGVCLGTSLLALLFAVSAPAQQSIEGQPVRDSPEQFLAKHHVSTMQEAVRAALNHDDSEVRKAAAHVLSSHWPKEAEAPLEAAMLRENDEWVRIAIASDLAELGDKAGREMLTTECHNASEWGSTRILAARMLTQLHGNSCIDAILEILQSDSDPQDTLARIEALNLVTMFIDHSTPQEYRKVLDLAMNALNDPDLGVRLTASVTLGRLADASAIPALQAAFAGEQEETVRSAMLVELKRLRSLQQGRKVNQRE
jgi:HEAT repeat protein